MFQPFVGCGFHQRAGMSSGATGMALRLASARVSVAVGVRRVFGGVWLVGRDVSMAETNLISGRRAGCYSD